MIPAIQCHCKYVNNYYYLISSASGAIIINNYSYDAELGDSISNFDQLSSQFQAILS